MNNWVYAIVIRDHNQEMTIEEKITEENMIDMYFVYFTYNLSIFEVKIYNLSWSVKIQSISLCNIKVYKNIIGKTEIISLKISFI